MNVISNEIRWGRLVAPKECSACENPTGRIEAHHPSYRFPKKIIWLCSSCHKLLHGGKL